MAPEQFLDSATADQRADIYSFGVILYAMATGELPIYPERTPKDQEEMLLLWAIAHNRGSVRRADFPLLALFGDALKSFRPNGFNLSTKFSRC